MRYLLAFFFLFMYMGDHLGLNISLGPGMSTKNLLLYLILTGIAINAAVARNRDFDLPSVIVPFVLLILYATMTWIVLAFVLDNPNYSLRQSFIALKSTWVDQFLTFGIFFFGLLYLKDSLWLLKTIIWIVIIGNVITIIDTFNIPNLGILNVPRKAGRFEGFLGQPNSYGQFLILFIPACIALYLRSTGKARVFAGIGTFATILALVLSGSRGSYVGLIGGAVLGAMFLRRFISSQIIVRASVISALICTVAVVVTIATGYANVWMDRTLNFEGSAHVITHGRTTIWATALKAMLEKPLSFISGMGFLAYETGMFRKAAHNVYLSLLYNLGLIGLSLFLIVFNRIMVTARAAIVHAEAEYRPQLLALIFGTLSFLIAIFFSEYQTSGYLLWAYLGVGMRISVQTMPAGIRTTGASKIQPVRASNRGAVAAKHLFSEERQH